MASTTKPLSQAQEVAAWKAASRNADMQRADKSLARRLIAGEFKGCKQGMGRGWKKWASKVQL